MDMMRIVGLVVLVLLLLVCAFFGSQDAMRNVQTVSTPGEWTVVVAQFVYVASAILAVAAMGARKSRLATGFPAIVGVGDGGSRVGGACCVWRGFDLGRRRERSRDRPSDVGPALDLEEASAWTGYNLHVRKEGTDCEVMRRRHHLVRGHGFADASDDRCWLASDACCVVDVGCHASAAVCVNPGARVVDAERRVVDAERLAVDATRHAEGVKRPAANAPTCALRAK
jgi:hypothetical protein